MDVTAGPPAMRYRVLGPVEVCSLAGEPLALGSPMQVRLLAILMSQPGTGWSIDQLVDELWLGRPPKTAAGNVKTYVWALRRALRSPGSPDPAILAGATGYRLVLDAQAMDSLAFDDLTQRGYHAMRQGRRSDALRAFEAALALWRGKPFAGLPGWGVLLSVRARLVKRRWPADRLVDHREGEEHRVELTSRPPGEQVSLESLQGGPGPVSHDGRPALGLLGARSDSTRCPLIAYVRSRGRPAPAELVRR
ncbi:AfsR/SARP family transcriptional regulator [Micromonospora cremea]|uniref:Transcriptional regulatory protein, C terminal n=1 Tax=Micromonospora cremea TaxID=709881 RepID=A0A1N5UHK9_9ACTN|nr:BTAD domain-containing putative transcriptional regulator [Micromonospora cremea]SIM60170.1 Transcriptional regulatory protein, C terminal [Micromonospora cremea]